MELRINRVRINRARPVCQLNMYAEIIRLTPQFQQIKVPPMTFQIPFHETKAKACPTLGF